MIAAKDQYNESHKALHRLIKEASDRGQFSIIIYEDLPELISKGLRDQGYTISTPVTYMAKREYWISWKME